MLAVAGNPYGSAPDPAAELYSVPKPPIAGGKRLQAALPKNSSRLRPLLRLRPFGPHWPFFKNF